MKNNGLRINGGISSVILILIVFALSVFAVLSVKSSNNELNMAKKSVYSVKEYYEADARAEEILSRIDKCLATGASLQEIKAINDSIKILENNGIVENIEYEVLIRDSTRLFVKLDIDHGLETKYSITDWKTEQEVSDEYEIVIPDLWDGDIEE